MFHFRSTCQGLAVDALGGVTVGVRVLVGRHSILVPALGALRGAPVRTVNALHVQVGLGVPYYCLRFLIES